jgi:hypothetical protein
MVDPFKTFFGLQKSFLDGWVSSASMVIQSWKHLFDLNERLLKTGAALGRNKTEIDDGPDFTGKYGKRRFDIDPDRDV